KVKAVTDLLLRPHAHARATPTPESRSPSKRRGMTGYLGDAFLLCLCMVVECLGQSETTTPCPVHQDIQNTGHTFLANIIPCSYIKEYRPPTRDNRPVNVVFTLYIQDINSFNAADMDFRMELFLHMTWVDTRLNLSNLVFLPGCANENKYITLPSYVMEYIWTPDPYVTNAKDAAITTLTTTYSSITIYDNHTIRSSSRLSSTIGCQMEFHGYPMDIQKCNMIMQSFMYSSNEVEFNWRKWSPVMINKDLRLLQFKLKNPMNNYIRNSSYDELGHGERQVRQLVLELEFSRAIGHHLVQTFVPSFLVVCLSWFSFWLGLDAIPGRVTLLVTSLLTLTTLFTGIKEGLPPVAYVKAIDVWMAGCMVFIFAALGEFVIVRWLNMRRPPKQTQENGGMMRVMTVNPSSPVMPEWDSEPSKNRHRNHTKLHQTPGRLSLKWVDPQTGEKKFLWKEIDKASRIVFPLMFLFFMIIYFPILIFRIFQGGK
ncbi:hypothetical protein OTU49_015442, partial [Cherax quadricarinatus]